MKPLRIVFAGTPDFAVPTLRVLLDSPHQVCAVYTQPDRPAGRGRKLTASPVKQCALEFGCEIVQPLTLRDESEQHRLRAFNADVMVVVAYGLILPEAVLQIPRWGCINVHASLLPRWRGAAPIQRALLAGDQATGVTIMQMAAGLDTGDMLHTIQIPISPVDTTPTLHDQLAERGAEALMSVLPRLAEGTLAPVAQDDSQAVYAEKLNKREARVDWSQNAEHVHRCIRAYLPWPVAETGLRGQRLRIWDATLPGETSSGAPGTVIAESKRGIDVATGDGVVRVTKLQLPGGKPLNVQQFVAANSLLGEVFE